MTAVKPGLAKDSIDSTVFGQFNQASQKERITMEREQLTGFGSVITIKGSESLEHPGGQCLGDLMYLVDKGTYDAQYGLVDITKEEADTHNGALDQMRLEGMDRNCEVGQGSFAYYVNGKVTTFLGTVVSDDVTLRGQKGRSIVFYRASKVYRGRLNPEYDAFNFRRVA